MRTTRPLLFVTALLLAGGCASGPPPAPTAASSTTTGRPGCNAATAEVVTQVTATLTGDAKKLGKPFAIEENERKYVGANILDGNGNVLSSADVWIVEKGKVYALSSGARGNSNAADGRELSDKPTAGVGNARFVSQCVQPS